jgi:hypothetical protein
MKKGARKKRNHTPIPVSVLEKNQLSRSSYAHLDQLLDESLEETFPASDPPSPAIDERKSTRR